MVMKLRGPKHSEGEVHSPLGGVGAKHLMGESVRDALQHSRFTTTVNKEYSTHNSPNPD